MKKRALPALVFSLVLLTCLTGYIAGCGSESKNNSSAPVEKMKLTSSFMSGDMIPPDYTCDGDSSSPPLIIKGVPSDAESLAIVVDDPDAPDGTFTHWIVWNISVNTSSITRGGVPGIQGTNDFGKTGYGAPCPPSGIHHYQFKILALDKKLELKEGASRRDFDKAIGGHIISQAALIGLYSSTD